MFDLPQLKSRLDECEEEMSQPAFWDNPDAAQKVSREANRLRSTIKDFEALQTRIGDLPLLMEMAAEEGTKESEEEFAAEYHNAESTLDKLEIQILLSGELDDNSAIISIHAGAGGTEACDWSNMLFRMYQRWAERHDMKWEVLDLLQGEEAGIKSATIRVEGELAYGFLKAERGVHRLVRISPFNAAGKRQTSFSSLDVVAEIDDDIEIEIEDKDIRVDVYRAGGPGGQGVNTTDSAVRITHLPTGLIVSCQNERSQIKNKASAMKVLKSRLYEVEMDKKRAEAEKHYSDKGEIGWGHQIRSYVLQPYQMIKDLRTGEQSSDVNGVLDGDLDEFIYAFLKGKKRTDTDDDDDV
ncbi:MAG: peptide chain release factor 2 [Verrucomicrobiota bacterium]